jgi:hypothetical protein
MRMAKQDKHTHLFRAIKEGGDESETDLNKHGLSKKRERKVV